MYVRFQVHAVIMLMKVIVFRCIVQRSLIDINRRFRGAYIHRPDHGGNSARPKILEYNYLHTDF